MTGIPAQMKAIRLHPPGGVDGLVFEDVETPSPRSREALVKVHAAAITRDELSWRADELPAIPSYELSGIVVERGEAAESVVVGQPVYGLTGFDRDGVAAEYAAVPATELAAKPESLTHVEAAAIPLPALSAIQGLFDHGQLEKNQRVLIHGGAGGVGAFAIQLARIRGAYVIATTSKRRVDTARLLAADEVLDHTASDFTTIEPVDLVFDTAGGERLRRSIDVLRPGGRLISVAEDPPVEIARQAGIEAKWYLVQSRPDQLVELAHLVDQGRLRGTVDETYHLTEAGEAFARLEGGSTGKIVLTVV